MTNCKDCTTNCVYRGKDNEARCRSFVGTVTNADHIRSMSDEKLALFVRAIISAESCPGIDCDCDECFFKEPCFNGSKWHGKEIEWLKQPAE